MMVDERPDEAIERAEFLLHGDESAGIDGDRLKLEPVRTSPGSGSVA